MTSRLLPYFEHVKQNEQSRFSTTMHRLGQNQPGIGTIKFLVSSPYDYEYDRVE